MLLNERLNVGYMVRSHKFFFLFKWVLDSLVSFKFWVRSLMILLTADTSVKKNPSNDSTLTLELRVHLYDFWFYCRTNVLDSRVFINRFISSTIFLFHHASDVVQVCRKLGQLEDHVYCWYIFNFKYSLVISDSYRWRFINR